jgi:predicted peptidase
MGKSELFRFLLIALFCTCSIYGRENIGSSQTRISRHEIETQDGLSIRYGLFIPEKTAEAQSIPLIIALHYGGRVTPYYGLDYMNALVLPALGKSGAIIAAPDCPHQNWTSEVSEKAVLRLIEHLSNTHPVDRRRIAITGFSMGGIGVWYMISRHPEIFSAAIVVSGMADSTDLEKIENTPVYIIHSDTDKILPVEPARAAYKFLRKTGVPVKLKIVRDVDHYNTPGFIPALQRTSSWLTRIWKGAAKTQ